MSLGMNRVDVKAMTLSTRLSLFFLTTLALVLVGFSITLYLLARMYLHRQSEERLEAALNTLVAAVEVGPGGVEWEPTERHLSLGPAAFGDQVLWLIGDDLGRIVDRSTQIGAEDFLAEASEHLRISQRSTKRLDWEGERWQFRQRWIQPRQEDAARPIASEPVSKKDEKKYPALSITAGVPLGSVQATLRQLAGAQVGLSLAIWLLAMFVGRIVCRRALLPVTKMATSARAMDAADLNERLPVIGTADELEELGRAFNNLLDRLQESFERQRQFTGDASHQLRTPLAAILGQIEVALRRERPVEEYQRVLTTVQNKAEHLHQIIESLLFLARANAEARLPVQETLDLKGWLPGYLPSWKDHPRFGDIIVDAGGVGSTLIKAQPVLLGELLHILLDNACKYSAGGTPITIRLSRADGFVGVAVLDQGCGISVEDQANLFTPFFRSEDVRRRGIQGLGLGLSIAKRLADAFRGILTVESRIGEGSIVTILLGTSSVASQNTVTSLDP
jgi:signal transduction histidine kinase